MSEARDRVVKLVDDHGVEHNVRVRAESVYEAAMKGARCPAALEASGESLLSYQPQFAFNPRMHSPMLLAPGNSSVTVRRGVCLTI